VQAEANQSRAMKISRHKTRRTFNRYDIGDTKGKKDAMKKIEAIAAEKKEESNAYRRIRFKRMKKAMQVIEKYGAEGESSCRLDMGRLSQAASGNSDTTRLSNVVADQPAGTRTYCLQTASIWFTPRAAVSQDRSTARVALEST